MRILTFLLEILAILFVVFIAKRYVARAIAALPVPWRAVCIAALALLAAIAPWEFFTRWSLVSPTLANAAYPVSFVAYLLLIFAVWASGSGTRTRPLAQGAAVLLTFPFIAAIFRGPVAILLAIVFSLQPQPIRRGQITPTLSYQLNPDHHIYFGTLRLEFRIYRHPAWLPMVHKEVAQSLLDGTHVACIPATRAYLDAYDPYSVAFAPGPDDHTVLVTCMHPAKALQPASSSTAAIALR